MLAAVEEVQVKVLVLLKQVVEQVVHQVKTQLLPEQQIVAEAAVAAELSVKHLQLTVVKVVQAL